MKWSRSTGSGLAIMIGVVLGMAAGCGSPSGQSTGPVPTPMTSSTSQARQSGTNSADALSERNLTPNCASGQIDLTGAAAPAVYRACVKVGSRLTIRIAPPIGRWMPFQNSSPSVITIADQRTGTGGEVVAELEAVAAGATTISTMSLHEGDPHGPPSENWILRLTVEP